MGHWYSLDIEGIIYGEALATSEKQTYRLVLQIPTGLKGWIQGTTKILSYLKLFQPVSADGNVKHEADSLASSKTEVKLHSLSKS